MTTPAGKPASEALAGLLAFVEGIGALAPNGSGRCDQCDEELDECAAAGECMGLAARELMAAWRTRQGLVLTDGLLRELNREMLLAAESRLTGHGWQLALEIIDVAILGPRETPATDNQPPGEPPEEAANDR